MIRQVDLGSSERVQKRATRALIKKQAVALAGNRQLKIYGRLCCGSGKRIKASNRVFFKNKAEAVACGYRPCGNCMQEKYQKWKSRKS